MVELRNDGELLQFLPIEGDHRREVNDDAESAVMKGRLEGKEILAGSGLIIGQLFHRRP